MKKKKVLLIIALVIGAIVAFFVLYILQPMMPWKVNRLAIFKKDTSAKEILHTKLGFEEPGAVWEITYISDSGKLNYVYLLFEDGNWWKRILNL